MVKPPEAEVLVDLQRRILDAQRIADSARADEIALRLERAREAVVTALRAVDREDLVCPSNPFSLS